MSLQRGGLSHASGPLVFPGFQERSEPVVIILGIERVTVPLGPDEEQWEKENKFFHTQRAVLVHGLVDALALDVTDWGLLDDSVPHEYVEIIVALAPAAAVILTAIAKIIQVWVNRPDRKRIERVSIRFPDGAVVVVEKGTEDEIQTIIATAQQHYFTQ